MKKRPVIYLVYIRVYTKYRAKYTVRNAYTRDKIVYTGYKQVYKSLNRYILTCRYIPVYIIVISIFHFRISWSAS
jgi:hypothetical protein